MESIDWGEQEINCITRYINEGMQLGYICSWKDGTESIQHILDFVPNAIETVEDYYTKEWISGNTILARRIEEELRNAVQWYNQIHTVDEKN